jgi:hypothetical protein
MRKISSKQRASKFAEVVDKLAKGVELFPAHEEEAPDCESICFRWQEVKWRKDYYKGERRNIPCIVVDITPDLTVKIYGSHLENTSDYGLTHLMHKSRAVDLALVDFHPELEAPPWLGFLDLTWGCWSLIEGRGVNLRGSASKGVFQGVMDDNDLIPLISLVNMIKRGNWEKHKWRSMMFERLNKILLPAIRDNNFKKIDLLKKVMGFCEMPRETPKCLIYNEALLEAARRHKRVPKPLEIMSVLMELECNFEEPLFYRDMKDIGLNWIIRRYSR